jgi:RNA polymerase sigma-70 factor, ECF subfamily
MLFQRILQNTIHDYFRREKVRSSWISLFSSFGNKQEDQENFDAMDMVEAEVGTYGADSGLVKMERQQVLDTIEREIQNLPSRQREAFLMRYWQDLNVSETAIAMGCSEGSVKTHCSRATHALAQALRAKGIYL